MNGESNLGQWTMRICDFMVDHLGEWVSGFEIVVVSLCFVVRVDETTGRSEMAISE